MEWLVTSILQPRDLESWTNTLCLMLFEDIMIKDPTLFGSFASQAMDHFGNSLFISVENFFKEQKGLPNEVIKEMVESIKKSLNSISIMYKKEETHFTLRVLNEN